MATLKDTIIDGSLRVRKDILLSGRTSIKDAYMKITSKDNRLILENFKGEETTVEIPIGKIINDDLDVGDAGADTHTWSINRIAAALRGDITLDHSHKISQVEGLQDVIDSIEEKTFVEGKVEDDTLLFSNKMGSVVSSIDLSTISGSKLINDELESSTENVWSISKVVEMLSSKMDATRATEFIAEKVSDLAQPILEEKLEDLGTIQRGSEAPTNLNMFWLDTEQ